MTRRNRMASRLRHRLTLQQPVLVADEGGGYTKDWQDVADLWAEIIPLGGRSETLDDEQLQSRVTHRILLRFRAGIGNEMRFALDDRVFNIRAVFNVMEDDIALSILAEEGVAV